MLCCAVLRCAAQCSAVKCCAVQCCAVLFALLCFCVPASQADIQAYAMARDPDTSQALRGEVDEVRIGELRALTNQSWGPTSQPATFGACSP